MHDDEQVGRLYDLHAALQAGNFPPRIAPNLGFGYGYPFFNFYPPFAYYVSEVFYLLGFSFIVSTKLMIAVGFLLAALFMYLFVKEIFGRVAGVVAAVSYTYASYHAVDVYVRGALAEFYAFVFLPVIFLASYKISKGKGWGMVIVGALGVSGLILSHNLVAFMSAPFIGLFLLYLLVITPEKKSFIARSILLFLFGFGLTAYFWLPSYIEREFTLINILTSELADYNLHFVCIRQLWDSPWGYGGSIGSCIDGLSFEIGKIQIILSLIALLLGIVFLRFKKYRQRADIIFVFSTSFLICIFLMVKFSKPIWDTISALWYIQFPWRFLLIASFITAILSGSVVSFIKNKYVQILAGTGLVILLILQTYTRFTPERFFNASDDHYTTAKALRWDTSSLAYEYVPKGISTKKSSLGTTIIDISEDEIATSSSEIISGDMKVKVIKGTPQEKTFEVQVERSGVLQINTYSFPGWTVYVDGKKTSYTDNNKLKLIHVYLPSGVHIITAKFEDTTIRTIGNIVSLISIIAVLGLVVISAKKGKNHAKA